MADTKETSEEKCTQLRKQEVVKWAKITSNLAPGPVTVHRTRFLPIFAFVSQHTQTLPHTRAPENAARNFSHHT